MNRDDIRTALDNFADTLEAAGFRVYRPGGRWTFIGFARFVDGKWCSATVQASNFGNADGWQWHMNIVPGLDYGSAMFLDEVPDGTPLTVEAATMVTVPEARNSVIPTQPNGGWLNYWNH